MSRSFLEFANQAVAPWDANPKQAKVALACYCTAVGIGMLMEKTFTIFEIPARQLLGEKSITDTAYTILLVTDACGGPVFGKVAQRYGVRYCLVIAAVLMLSATACLVTGVTLTTFYVGHFLGGLSIASIYAPCNIAAVQLMPRTKQGLASSLTMFSIVAFCAVCVFPVKQVIEHYGAHIGYGVQGLGVSTALCLCAFFLPAPPNPPEEAGSRLAEPNEAKAPPRSSNHLGFAVLYIAYLSGVSTYYFLEAQIQPILEDTLPHQTTILKMALPLFLVEEGCARIVWGYIACTRSAAWCLLAGVALVAAGFNLWAFFAGACFGELTMAALSFLGATALWPLMPVLVARIFPPDQAMSLYALLNTAGILAGIISGPVAAVLSSSLGWPTTLHLFSLLPMVMAGAILMRTLKDEARALSLQWDCDRQGSPQSELQL